MSVCVRECVKKRWSASADAETPHNEASNIWILNKTQGRNRLETGTPTAAYTINAQTMVPVLPVIFHYRRKNMLKTSWITSAQFTLMLMHRALGLNIRDEYTSQCFNAFSHVLSVLMNSWTLHSVVTQCVKHADWAERDSYCHCYTVSSTVWSQVPAAPLQ